MLSVCDPAAHRDPSGRRDEGRCQNEGRRPPVQRFSGFTGVTASWTDKWKEMNLAMRTDVEQLPLNGGIFLPHHFCAHVNYSYVTLPCGEKHVSLQRSKPHNYSLDWNLAIISWHSSSRAQKEYSKHLHWITILLISCLIVLIRPLFWGGSNSQR